MFVLPSVFVMFGLSWLFAVHGDVSWVSSIFAGLAPAVIAIVAAATIRIGRTALANGLMRSGRGGRLHRDLRAPPAVPGDRARGAADRRRRRRRQARPVRRRRRPRPRGAGTRRDPRRRTAPPPHGAVEVASGGDARGRAGRLARADRDRRGLARAGGHAHRDGMVLLPGVARHVRRCLRRAGVRERRCGADLRMAPPRSDGGRPRPRGEHARPADHGAGVRRVRRGLPAPRRPRSARRRHPRRLRRGLGDLRAVLPLDLPRSAVRGGPAGQPSPRSSPRDRDRRRRRRDREPRRDVRDRDAVHRGRLRPPARPLRRAGAGVVERRPVRGDRRLGRVRGALALPVEGRCR